METPIVPAGVPQAVVELMRVVFPVDYAAHAAVLRHFSGDVLQRYFHAGTYLPFNSDTAGFFVEFCRVGDYLAGAEFYVFPRVIFGLGRGRKKDGTAEHLAQRADGFHGSPRKVGGYALRFIENNNAVRNAVQKSQVSRLRLKQRFKELDRSSNYHRRRPALGIQPCLLVAF